MHRIARFVASLFLLGSLAGSVDLATPGMAGASTGADQSDSGAVLLTSRHSRYGQVLFTADARALYVLSFDTVGTRTAPAASTCVSTACATAWPPLLAAGPNGPFDIRDDVDASQVGTIQRPDGTWQVTYFGHPLYKFIRDTAPDQTNGENVAAFNGIWHLLTVGGQPDAGDATVSLESSANGPVLDTPTAFSTYRSLYLLTTDPPNKSVCVGACARIWPPLLTNRPPAAGSRALAAGLGTIRRPDGTTQVTYVGHPLYLFAFDLFPGAPSGLTNGEDLVDPTVNGVWYTVAPSGGAAPAPATVTSESAGALGTILAFSSPNPSNSATGPFPGPFTLYAFSADTATKSKCTGACARAWPPLLTDAPPSAASGSGVSQTGLGTIVRPDGTLQVTYFGHPLYLFAYGTPPFTGTSGEGIAAFGGTFQVVSLAGTPQ